MPTKQIAVSRKHAAIEEELLRIAADHSAPTYNFKKEKRAWSLRTTLSTGCSEFSDAIPGSPHAM